MAAIAAANKMLRDAGIEVKALSELETESPTWSARLEQFIHDSRQPGEPPAPPGDV